MEKKLSVTIPCYNVSEYLNETLDSLIRCRTIDFLDIIIVDDGSKDNTLDIANSYVKQYPDSIRIVAKENGGHGSTINEGLKIAVGKYFAVIDGDDWVDSGIMDELVNYLAKVDTDVVITGHYKNFVTINKEETFGYSENRETEYNIGYAIERNLRFPMTDICYRTKILQDMKLTIQEHTFYVDEEFCTLPFMHVSRIRFFGKGYYHYRIGSPNQSISLANTIKRIDHRIRVFKRIYELTDLRDMASANSTYINNKLIGLAKAILVIYYVKFEKRQEGYKQGELFYTELVKNYPKVSLPCKRMLGILRLFNKFRISASVFENLFNIMKTLKL